MTMLRTWSMVENPAWRTVTRSLGTKSSGRRWAVSMTTRSQPAPGSAATTSSPASHGGGSVVDDANGTSAAWVRVVVVILVGGGAGSVAAVCVESHVTHRPSADATRTTAMATPAAHPFIDEATYAAPAPRVGATTQPGRMSGATLGNSLPRNPGRPLYAGGPPPGDVAQLARAPALQAGGRGFESHRLHFV
jgi:hypothetical protein